MSKNDSDKSSNFSSWQSQSRLDPVDTSRVGSSIVGIFLRRLFTFKLRTHNVFSLFTMLFFGVAATGLMLFAFYGFITSPVQTELDIVGYIIFTGLYLMLGLVLLIGIALLINFAINVGIIFGFWKNDSDKKNRIYHQERKRKMPKRRKDYK